MIAPRQIRLVSVPTLGALQRAIAARALDPDPWVARKIAVIVPSRTAAAELRRSLENRALQPATKGDTPASPTPRAIVFPELLTRADWYAAMHAALPGAAPWLSDLEREVLLGRALGDAVAAGMRPPFRLRPGLVVEILAFYDALLRQRKSVDSFERLVLDDLAPQVETDRGAARLFQQTQFLVAAFRSFGAHVASSGGLDEHALRARLLAGPAASPFTRVIVTVGDQAADSDGLWGADFDLLARLDGLERVEFVLTERLLGGSLLERLRGELPELEEGTGAPLETTVVSLLAPGPAPGRGAGCPAGGLGDGQIPETAANHGDPALARLFWMARDREDELADVARRIKMDANPSEPLERTAVVFRRPLPYVYLAQTVFEAAGVGWQVFDALPLAAEPYAAAVDLVFAFMLSGFRASSALALMRSPHFAFRDESGRAVGQDAVALLQRALEEAGLTDDRDALTTIASHDSLPQARRLREPACRASARAAARAALDAAADLDSLTRPAPASAQIDALLRFLESRGLVPAREDPVRERTLRCRAAIVGALRHLSEAHRRHHDPPLDIRGLAPRIRRWMEGQTFTPSEGPGGVHLLDAVAARYGDFDTVHLVGLVEGEWPPRPVRSVFYPPVLLARIGWLPEAARAEAHRAAFFDLVKLGARVSLSTFRLEEDAIVEPSPFLDELPAADLAVVLQPAGLRPRVSADEALALEPVRLDVPEGAAAAWVALRASRSDQASPAFHGQAVPAGRSSYPVRAVEEYVKCPFRYFARYVLALPEESRGERAAAARARGLFVHDLLQAFFDDWQRSGRGAITTATLDEARARFQALVAARLETVPARDRALLAVRLLGSPFAPAVVDSLARLEIERDVPVAERLLEFRLEGPCTVRGTGSARTLPVTGIADRIDLLADGTFDLIDYKLGRAPNLRHAVQLPLYAVHAAEVLTGRSGRAWRLRDAAYVAFAGPDRVVSFTPRGRGGLDQALTAGQDRFLAAVDGIEAGAFPPRPAETSYCTTCAYQTVCRKDYVHAD